MFHPQSGSQGYQAPPPPPPCYQNYTRYTVGPWSACAISGNWSSSGVASCTQTRSVIPFYESHICGTSSDTPAQPSTRNQTLAIDFANPTNSCI